VSLPPAIYHRLPKRLPLSLGFSRYSLRFPGVEQYVELDTLPITGAVDVTLSAWARFTVGAEPGLYRKIICLGNQAWGENIQLFKNEDGSIVAGVWGQAPVNAKKLDLNDGRWHYIVGLFEGGTKASLVVDGVLIGTDDVTYNVTLGPTTAKHIGGRIDGDFWDGYIDIPMVYDRLLGMDEVRRNMLNYHSPIRYGLIVWLPFEEGVGLTAYDKSGVGNNGSLLPTTNPPKWIRNKMWELRAEVGL